MIKRVLSLCLLMLLATTASSQEIRGLYVNGFKNIVGDSLKEDSLLQFAQDYNFNYLLLYNLYHIHTQRFSITDPTESDTLADFIEKAKTAFGVLQVGATGETFNSFTNIDNYQQDYAGQPNKQFDSYNIEYEFWNTGSTGAGGYYCTTYLTDAGLTCDTAGAFTFYLEQIQRLDSLANVRGVLSETYIGHPTAGQSRQIGDTLDRVLVHYYRGSDVYGNGNSIYNYNSHRLEDLAPTNDTLDVLPIFASTSSFMGSWLETNSLESAYDTWMNGQNAWDDASGSWKDHINIQGYQWYAYSSMYPITGLTLPVELLDFSVTTAAGHDVLSWQTSSETNASRFWLQRSNEGRHWETIGSAKAAGTASIPQRYHHRTTVAGWPLTYYRLVLENVDGTRTTLATTVAKRSNAAESPYLYPTVATTSVTIGGLPQGTSLVLSSLTGRAVEHYVLKTAGQQTLLLPKTPPGSYVLHTIDGSYYTHVIIVP